MRGEKGLATGETESFYRECCEVVILLLSLKRDRTPTIIVIFVLHRDMVTPRVGPTFLSFIKYLILTIYNKKAKMLHYQT